MGVEKMGVKGKKSKKQKYLKSLKQKDTKAPLPDKIQLSTDTQAVIENGNLVIYLGEDLKSVTVEKQSKPQKEDKTYQEEFQSADSKYRSHLIEESKKTKPPEQISTEPTFLDRLKKCTTEALENTGKEFDAEVLQDTLQDSLQGKKS